MKPIYLEMTAFCSYCGTAKIDFTRLYENGIFLITGKTGGGKTTILDAVCTALYGSATGSQRSKEWEQLRCLNAPDSQPTVVDFTFSLGESVYRFRRELRKRNSKKENAKLVDVNECYRKTGEPDEWQLIVSGKTNVNREAEKILNLTREQFVKVIMLPQGEFRELLIASTTDKGKILETLFGTERWKLIAKGMAKELSGIEERCRTLENGKAAALAGAGCASSDELKEKIARTGAQLDEYSQREQSNLLRTKQAQESLNAATVVAGQFDELETKKALLANLKSQASMMAEYEKSLEHSQKLQKVLSEFDQLSKARENAGSIQQRLETAKSAKASANAALTEAQRNIEKLPELEQTQKRLSADNTTLTELTKDRPGYESAVASLGRKRKELDELQTNRAVLEKNRAATEERIKNGRQYLEENRPDDDAHNNATLRRSTLEKTLDLALEYEKKARRLSETAVQAEQAESAIRRCLGELESRKRTLEAVDHAIRLDRAYSLAAGLAEGTPCPVCGSVHHPSPALPARSTPTSEDLEECRRQVEAAQRHWQEAQSNHSRLSATQNELEQDIKALIEKNAGEELKSASQIRAEFDKAKAECESLEKQAKIYAKSQITVNGLISELSNIISDIQNIDTHINLLKVEIASHSAKADATEQRLKAYGMDGFEALDKKLSAVRAELRRTESAAAAVSNAMSEARSRADKAQAAYEAADSACREAAAELRVCQANFEKRCMELDIPAGCDVRAEKLPDSTMAEYAVKIQNYRQALFSAGERIGQLSDELEGKVRPDTDALRKVYEDSVNEGRTVSAQIGSLKNSLETLRQTTDTVSQYDSELGRLTAKYSTAKRMATLLSCEGNSLKMSIDIYVLSIKLEEVIHYANHYLRQLTNGQLEMKRKTEASGRDKYQGLDIEIIDGSLGGVRAVSTLSGGEMFLASLSLAFGLSDTVQSFAGGVHLDSLFIDEGFGSLDSETLDTAMNAITRIGKNKLLGIISHVSELRERIPCRIEVVKNGEGSSLEIRA